MNATTMNAFDAPSPGSRAEKAATTRAALVAAARRLFADNGYHATGTPDIVSAAGVTRGALYHHFRDKEELFEAVFRSVAKELETAASESVVALMTDPWLQLQEGLQAFLRLVAQSPEMQRIILLDGPVVFGWSKWRDLQSEYTRVYLVRSLELLMGLGTIEKRAPDPLAHLLTAALNDAAMAIANAPDPAKALPEVADALRALVAGLEIRK